MWLPMSSISNKSCYKTDTISITITIKTQHEPQLWLEKPSPGAGKAGQS